MSSSAGIGGAFGLLLPEFPQVAAIYGDLKLAHRQGPRRRKREGSRRTGERARGARGP